MKVLITGATGFIGSQLIHRLSKKNYEIACFTRNVKIAQQKIKSPCLFYEWKNYHSPPPDQAFKNVSAIINLAGESIIKKKWSEKQKKILTESRVNYTHQLVKAAQQHSSIHTLINASAIGYYGHRENDILNENSPQGRGFLSHLCINWEKNAHSFKHNDKRVIIFRIGNVLSSKGGIIEKMTPMFQLGLGSIFSNGFQWMSWIHINDLINLFICALENQNWNGIFNATSPHPVTHKQWVKIFAKSLHRPVLFRIPHFILKMMFGEMSQLFLHSQRVIPERAQRKGFIFDFPQISMAMEDIIS